MSNEQTDALEQALFLLDTFAGEGIGHIYGNGQELDASDVCTELADAFDLQCEPGWHRVLAARLTATPSPSTDTLELREALPDAPWFLFAIGGKVGDRFRNTVILDCSPDMKELGPEFHWEDTFEAQPPEHLPAGAYVWSGFQLGGWAEDDPIVAKGGTFTAYAALTPSPRVDEGRALRREGIVAFSADIENPRVLKLHFDQDVTSAHRSLILDAINARRAALATTPADPRVGKMGADLEAAKKALRVALDHYDRNVCHHDDVHRGGFIWTICDQCGSKWADDEGGFKPFEYPPEIEAAFATLSQIEGGR